MLSLSAIKVLAIRNQYICIHYLLVLLSNMYVYADRDKSLKYPDSFENISVYSTKEITSDNPPTDNATLFSAITVSKINISVVFLNMPGL